MNRIFTYFAIFMVAAINRSFAQIFNNTNTFTQGDPDGPFETTTIEAVTKECKDEEECAGQTIADIDSVGCYGYGACRNTTIDATDRVEAYGYLSNENGDISTNKFEAYGFHSGYNSKITSDNVYGYGYYSLQYATIKSGNNNKLILNLDGFNSGYMSSVSCYEDDTCEIYCGTARGCRNLDFYCYSKATCYYNCNDDSDNCPSLYGGIGSMVFKKIEMNDYYVDEPVYFDNSRESSGKISSANSANIGGSGTGSSSAHVRGVMVSGLNKDSKSGLTSHEMELVVKERNGLRKEMQDKERKTGRMDKDMIDNAIEYYKQKGEKMPQALSNKLFNNFQWESSHNNSARMDGNGNNNIMFYIYGLGCGVFGLLIGIVVTSYVIKNKNNKDNSGYYSLYDKNSNNNNNTNHYNYNSISMA